VTKGRTKQSEEGRRVQPPHGAEVRVAAGRKEREKEREREECITSIRKALIELGRSIQYDF